MKKKGYYEYENGIYPLKLWVHIGKDLKELIDSCFDKCNAPDSDYGGVIVVQPSHTSAVREILDPYIGEDGFIKECGLRKVHTEEHGDFCIILYHNPSEVMALRAFYLNSKKK